jgi:long-chain acyl-CoA synthetase
MNPTITTDIDHLALGAPVAAHSEVAPAGSGSPPPAGAGGPPQSLGALALQAAASHRGVALEYEHNGTPVAISYPGFGESVREIARGLIALGIDRGERVAILGATSADWTIADFGTLCAGAVVVPIYHTNSPEECAYVLAHSGARLVFCEDAAQAAKLASVREQCPELEHVVLFHGTAPNAMPLSELRRNAEYATPRSVALRLADTEPDSLATLVYTSGTTGPPKACMLTHRNLLATSQMYVEQLGIDETHSLYQFLPLAHVLARVAQAVVIRAGARACFWSGDASRIVEEFTTFSPTHLPAVPRIYETMHGAITGRAEDSSPLRRAIFTWSLEHGRRARAALRAGRRPSLWARLQYALADRLVLAKVRTVFGSSLQTALVGAAPVARELLEFFDACGVLVLEGYGLSESCAASTLNTPTAVCFGTVGRPLPGTEVTIAEDGEILIRGPHVFSGYFRDPAATEAVLDEDGWLRSGDLGSISDEGFVTITGRKKDLIITSSGKNITPVNIESLLRDGRYTSEAVVFGDNRPYLVAMLTLDPDQARALAAHLGIADDPATIARDPGVRAAIQKEVDAVNVKLARIEQIKRFAILDHEFSQADGELTPTLKVKRADVYTKYQAVFGELYTTGSAT